MMTIKCIEIRTTWWIWWLLPPAFQIQLSFSRSLFLSISRFYAFMLLCFYMLAYYMLLRFVISRVSFLLVAGNESDFIINIIAIGNVRGMQGHHSLATCIYES